MLGKRQLQKFLEEQKREEEERLRAEESSDGELPDEDPNAVKNSAEKITEEEYDFQSRVLTKQEIRHLVNSDAYKRLMEAKGNDPVNWNWQLHDKSQGFFPMTEDDQI